jgi:UDP-2,4-diacetamido-2,4,6-trideoxy-beta-L-idose 2-epimerase
MTRKIAVFTGTRAEYGLLHFLLADLDAHAAIELQLIVSGAHLSPEFGETVREIEQDGRRIDAQVEMLLSSNSAVGVVKSMGVGMIGYADALERLRPDLLIILGDRFEALAIAQAALVMRIPIAHVHGGEISEGAFDDAIRHAITKMASLHFVAAERYRQRVIQMGAQPSTVFNVGALGLDHLTRAKRMSHEALCASLGFALRQPYFLVTYHPVTQLDETPEATFSALLDALDAFPEHQVLITYPNADNGGRALIPMLLQYAAGNAQRVCAVQSLGFKRYHSALDGAAAMVGNSSSGIIEAPAFAVPTVNVGTRQLGRLAAQSVLHCAPQREAIRATIAQALSPAFAATCRGAINPYGQGNAAQRIVEILAAERLPFNDHFFDIEATH